MVGDSSAVVSVVTGEDSRRDVTLEVCVSDVGM